jgi:hypothetical protein
MYIVLRENMDISKYNGAKKVSIKNYSSKNVEMLSKPELEAIVMGYLKNHPIKEQI